MLEAPARRRAPMVVMLAMGRPAALPSGMMHWPTAWGWYWLSLVFLIVVPELYWVFVNARNTISDTIWDIEGLNLAHPLDFAQWTPLHWAIAILLWLLFAWLSVHLTFGWIR
jgi:hypothetical protein